MFLLKIYGEINKDKMDKIDNITRLEVISGTGKGRLLILNDLEEVKLSLQDNEKTLKIFVRDSNETKITIK